MKYKALFSPKQFFSIKGSVYKAQDGIFETNDERVIEFLKGHFAWKCLTEKNADKKIKIDLKAKKEADKK